MAEKALTKIERETAAPARQQHPQQQEFQQQPKPAISQMVPGKPLAKKAAITDNELQGYLDTLKNPQSTEAQVSAALGFITANQGAPTNTSLAYSQAQINSILDAVMTRIPLYGDPSGAAVMRGSELQTNNLVGLTTILRNYVLFSIKTLPEDLFSRALETYSPFINVRVPVWIQTGLGDPYGAYAFFSSAFQQKTAAGEQIAKGTCDGLARALLPALNWSNMGPATAIGAICVNRQGDLDSYMEIIQKYKGIKDSLAYLDGVFPLVLSYRPDAITKEEYESFLGYYPQTRMLGASGYPTDVEADKRNMAAWIGLLKVNGDVLANSSLIGSLYKSYESLGDDDGRKKTYHWCILAWSLMDPKRLESPEISGVTGLDAETARGVADRIPDGGSIYTMSQLAQWKMGEPVLGTLIRQTNIMQFGQYPLDVLKHLYADRETVSEKPIMFMAFTTRPMGVDFAMVAFNAFDYTKFDIRAIEPATDDRMVSLMTETSARLGKKFRYLMVNGHGSPEVVLLKRAAGISSASLDVGDKELLKQIKPLLVQRGTDVILNSCSTAGDNKGDADLAKVVAETLEARCFGATMPTAGVAKISFDANLQVSGVAFSGAGTGVYDYRTIMYPVATGAAQVPKELLARHTGSTFIISGAYTQNAECTIYDAEGRTIAKKLRSDTSNNFVWDAARVATGVYLARIADEGRTTTLRLNKN
jgi:hypothetical protein